MEKKVDVILPKEAAKWIVEKHYSHKAPMIIVAFGLFIDKALTGIVSFGLPPNPHLDMMCGELSRGKVIELNRLVLNNDAPLNSASFLIARALKILGTKLDYKICVSFADTAYNHTGYIYQASNFLYTGISKGSKKLAYEGGYHPRTVLKNSNLKKVSVTTSDKHRYIRFIGNKKENEELKKFLKLRIFNNYPKDKTEPMRYKSAPIKEKQRTL